MGWPEFMDDTGRTYLCRAPDLINVEGARARGLQAVHVRSSADVAHAFDALGL